MPKCKSLILLAVILKKGNSKITLNDSKPVPLNPIWGNRPRLISAKECCIRLKANVIKLTFYEVIMDEKKAREAINRWEAMIIDYSKDAKELKFQIKKEFEEALEYFNNIKD